MADKKAKSRPAPDEQEFATKVAGSNDDPANAGASIDRMKEALKVKSDIELGAIIGVTPQAISKARKQGRIPPDWVLTTGLKSGRSLDWLFLGTADQAELQDENKVLKDELAKLQWQTSVPVLGLADCGIKGWQVKKASSLKTQPPPDMADPNGTFAVIAFGDSMIPLGINEGFLLYCDEATEPAQFDVVYIEHFDNRATVKQFVGYSKKGKDEYLVLQGYLPSKGGLPQEPFTLEVIRSQVAKIAVVRYIKRGL
jgi:SOS-response transcriptional repressor LexA